jgi:hypothetical protein
VSYLAVLGEPDRLALTKRTIPVTTSPTPAIKIGMASLPTLGGN